MKKRRVILGYFGPSPETPLEDRDKAFDDAKTEAWDKAFQLAETLVAHGVKAKGMSVRAELDPVTREWVVVLHGAPAPKPPPRREQHTETPERSGSSTDLERALAKLISAGRVHVREAPRTREP